MPEFIPGLKLGELFYKEAVKPALDAQFPGLPHTAAIIGSGSEVLGFDDAMSTDHHWGPRVMVFLTSQDLQQHQDAVHQALAEALPYTFYGYSTNFTPPDPEDNGTQGLEMIDQGPVNHRVEIETLAGYVQRYLGFDITQEITPQDWLTFSFQKLRVLIAGAVYHDDLGLADLRTRLAWYPEDVWRYQLAAVWTRIGQDEHLMGRSGFAGDNLGASVIGSRLVRDVMRLAFLMEKQYPPYPKWFGTGFQRLACAGELTPYLRQAQLGKTWQEIEAGLSPAYEYLARMHNALGLTDPLPETVSSFHGRPFMVIHGEQFAAALLAGITDPAVRQLTQHRIIGSIDLFSDSTDLLEDAGLRTLVRGLFQD